MPSHTKYLFASSANCHHPERISCNITQSWKLQPVVSPPRENVATPLYWKLSLAQWIFRSCHFHMCWGNKFGKHWDCHCHHLLGLWGDCDMSLETKIPLGRW